MEKEKPELNKSTLEDLTHHTTKESPKKSPKDSSKKSSKESPKKSSEKSQKTPQKKSSKASSKIIPNKPPKTAVRASKYTIIGIILTLLNFIIYTLLARSLFNNNNELLWLDSIISYLIATVAAYLLHSKITWRERHPGKKGLILFFAWNIITAIAISPLLTWFFGFMTPVYELAFSISNNLHLPFDYNFIESTGIFGFTALITMTLNYLCYDKIVFGLSESEKQQPIKTYLQNTNHPQNPKVSIIIPIYNSEKYLKSCLNSVINQTHSNLEIILINDGSTDDSKQIIENYAKKDPRVKVIHQKNQGQSIARNVGLKHATGEYISFIDSDDKIAKDFIEKLLLPYLNDSKTTLTVCSIKRIYIKNHKNELLYHSPILKKSPHTSNESYILKLLARDGRLYPSVNKIYQAEIAKKITFDPKLNFAEDTKFVLDYLKATKSVNIVYIQKPLYIYNFGTETSTITSSSLDWQNWQKTYRNLKTWLGKNPTLYEKLQLRLIHLRWRISYLRSKHRAKQ